MAKEKPKRMVVWGGKNRKLNSDNEFKVGPLRVAVIPVMDCENECYKTYAYINDKFFTSKEATTQQSAVNRTYKEVLKTFKSMGVALDYEVEKENA